MRRRTGHLRRAWNIWLVVPEAVRMALILLAVVFLAWFSGSVYAQDVVVPVPAAPICRDGRLVGITIIVPMPGRITFSFPADLCAKPKEPPPPPPRGA